MFNMKKPIFILVIYTIIFSTLINVQATITEYNFTVEENIWAYEDEWVTDNDIIPANTIPPDDEANITTDTDIEKDDSNRETTYLQALDSGYIYVKADVQESEASVSKLNWSWKGFGGEAMGNYQPNMAGYFWNFSDSTWDNCIPEFNQALNAEVNKNCIIESGVADAINTTGEAYFLMYGYNEDFDGRFMYTDILRLRVTYSADTCTPTTGANWDITISDNCTKSDTNIDVKNITITGSNGYFTLSTVNLTYENLILDCTNCKFIREGTTRVIAE